MDGRSCALIPVIGATIFLLESPRGIHIPKHTHEKGETHIVVAGSLVFEQGGSRLELEAGGYVYMPGNCVHEAWAPAGCRAIIILEGGWKVDWVEGPPGEGDLME